MTNKKLFNTFNISRITLNVNYDNKANLLLTNSRHTIIYNKKTKSNHLYIIITDYFFPIKYPFVSKYFLIVLGLN